MDRRSLLATLGLGSITALSGCLTLEGIDGGVLTVMQFSPPETVDIVPASDDRLSEAKLIHRALDHVTRHSPHGVTDFRLTRGEYTSVAETLERLPYYDRWEHGTSIPSGFYVSHDAVVYRLVSTPLCSDVPFVSAENSRHRCWTSVPEETVALE